NAWMCVVDAGPHGGDRTGHAHTDLGHVEIAHGTVHITADPGCPAYTPHSSARDWFRSEEAHACLVLPGFPLAEPAGSFSWKRCAPTPSVESGDTGELWWCLLAYSPATGSLAVRHVRQVVLVR